MSRNDDKRQRQKEQKKRMLRQRNNSFMCKGGKKNPVKTGFGDNFYKNAT